MNRESIISELVLLAEELQYKAENEEVEEREKYYKRAVVALLAAVDELRALG